MDIFLKYYGLDWLAMASSLLAVYLIGNKNRIGFISYILANALWIYLGVFKMQSFGISVGNVFFLMMNLRGFLKWKKDKNNTNKNDD
ncbi:MAG: nicotinamide mononucleotide transporter [Flectobacillus sp.]|jgi:nicotinamide riboside transporter PnuC|nr:nicotinamide mononucleotide transporter [Flectobacillus sp.]